MADIDWSGYVERIGMEARALRARLGLVQDVREREALLQQLRRERDEARSAARARELGEDRQVGMQADPLDSPDPDR